MPFLWQRSLTRTITARVSDEQYDWLVEDAVNHRDGDLSKALRYAIETARAYEQVLGSEDPVAEMESIVRRREEQDMQDLMEDADRWEKP
jgi:hypothetical protein